METPRVLFQHETNELLRQVPIGTQRPVACLLTGSSGCGKTFLGEALGAGLDRSRVSVLFPDKPEGVPSVKEMIEECGSIEQWQEGRTHRLISRIAEMRDKALVILDSQFHPRFAIEGLGRAGLDDYVLAVVTCDEDVWKQRLRGHRKQPALITDEMVNWWRLLREETPRYGGLAIDTSDSNLERFAAELLVEVNEKLRRRISTG